jgi:hypothetical protein
MEFLDFPRDGGAPPDPGPFRIRFNVVTETRPSEAIKDLKSALNTPGAVVVYMSHTELGKQGAVGLRPEPKKKFVLKNADLVKLLEKATANAVVLAGCATSVSVPKKLKNDIVVITTDSGRDGKTNSLAWSRAIAAFLFALVGYRFDPQTDQVKSGSVATIKEAIAAAMEIPRFRSQGE